MTHREQIKILKELREWTRLEQVEESLNLAIKICEKHVSKKEAKKK